MKTQAFLALLLVFSIILPAVAQTTPTTPAQTPTPPPVQQPGDEKDDVVRITTNLVQVDAVVTKDGKPVPNLTAEDFEIYQDGKKQTITSFAYITNVPNPTAPSQPARGGKKTEVIPFTPINREDPHRTIAVVVDDLGLSFQSMAQARKQLRKFIDEQLQANDLVAVIRTGGEMGALQQFTNDKRILGRAVEMLRWNYCSRVGIDVFASPGARSIPACALGSMTNTLRSLRFVLDSMGQLPGRKSLVLLSDSLPRQSQDEFQQDRSVPRELEAAFGTDSSPLSTYYDDHGNFLQSLAEKAIRSSVVIYSVDTQGLQTLGITAADSFTGTSREVAIQMDRLLAARRKIHFDRQEGGAQLSRQTGGFQVRNSNSFQLNRIAEDQTGYYLIGYRPTEETFNRKFHHIKAKVKRRGMSLRTRYGFYGVTEEDAKKMQPTVRDLTNLALASPFRAQDIEVDQTSFFAEEPSIGSMVRSFVYLHVKDLEFRKVDGKNQSSIEMHGAIFGDNGSLAEQMMRGATLNFTDSQLEAAKTNGIGLSVNMPVKRHGSYQIRIAVRDRHSSKIGSAGQFVIVPNLKDKKLGASGIILAKLDHASAPNDTDQTVANPGSRRFAPNSDLYYAFRLYNGAVAGGSQLRDLMMQAKLFRDGKAVFAGPETPIIAGNQKDLERVHVDGVIKLGLELEPGIYYLQVVIIDRNAKSKDAPVVQWVDFEIAKSDPPQF